MSTALAWHELCMWHDTGNAAGIIPSGLQVQPLEHAEHPDTKRRLKNLLDASGLTEKLRVLTPAPVSDAQILAVHTKTHFDYLSQLNKTGGMAGDATPMGAGSLDIARLSAGGLIAVCDAIIAGDVDNGYALTRPPGHHATADQAMGFCLLSNVAIAVKHLQSALGIGRVAVVDWDVHHGNGTQSVFYDDPSVLTISIHQADMYPPQSGQLDEQGEGDGLGANLNIPLPSGSGYGAYADAMDRVVVPALRRFQPDFIIVASGLDAGAFDPMGRMMLYAEAFADMTKTLMKAADELCSGRLALNHEGGYNPNTVPYAGLAIIEALSGLSAGIEDPFHGPMASLGGQELQSHQAECVTKAADLVPQIPVRA